uniref:Uncharacterized protein n=1 Tax=Strongyloides venezuelensis TaxID=75913 RepID=A0A0K0FIU4_STRVS
MNYFYIITLLIFAFTINVSSTLYNNEYEETLRRSKRQYAAVVGYYPSYSYYGYMSYPAYNFGSYPLYGYPYRRVTK